jgi:hypothetical protein
MTDPTLLPPRNPHVEAIRDAIADAIDKYDTAIYNFNGHGACTRAIATAGARAAEAAFEAAIDIITAHAIVDDRSDIMVDEISALIREVAVSDTPVRRPLNRQAKPTADSQAAQLASPASPG